MPILLVNLVVDSYGKYPAGVLNGNYYGFGSFSECFHIERNGVPYETQYCIAKVVTKDVENPNKAE